MIHRLLPYHPNRGLSAKMRALAVEDILTLSAGTVRACLSSNAKALGIKISYKTQPDGSILLRRVA